MTQLSNSSLVGDSERLTPALEMMLVDTNGSLTPATIEVDIWDRIVDGFRKTNVSLVVRWAGGEVKGSDWSYFHALCRVREQLAPLGLMPHCYGACRNLVLSGMCLDMALGRKGYLARLGQRTQLSDLVSIFAVGPNMDLTSVEEQAEFKQLWLRSLGWPATPNTPPDCKAELHR